MRLFISTIIILLCFSCTRDRTTADNQAHQSYDSTFGNNLIMADFLLYADRLKIDSLADQVKKSFDIYDDRNNNFMWTQKNWRNFNSIFSYLD
jgi:hypothetical protein